MEVLTKDYTAQTNIPDSESQLRRLERKQRELVQWFGKLGSYLCEPRTYDQFKQLDELKTKARQLRNVNNEICHTLKTEGNSTVLYKRQIRVHFQNFDAFTQEVLSYLGKAKLHQTAHI